MRSSFNDAGVMSEILFFLNLWEAFNSLIDFLIG